MTLSGDGSSRPLGARVSEGVRLTPIRDFGPGRAAAPGAGRMQGTEQGVGCGETGCRCDLPALSGAGCHHGEVGASECVAGAPGCRELGGGGCRTGRQRAAPLLFMSAFRESSF